MVRTRSGLVETPVTSTPRRILATPRWIALFLVPLLAILPSQGSAQDPSRKPLVDEIPLSSNSPIAAPIEEPVVPSPESPAIPSTEPILVQPSSAANPTLLTTQPVQPATELPRPPTTTAITGFTFTGNSIIPAVQLESIIRPYIGQPLTLSILEEAARAVTELYRQRGYTLATAYIPRQNIKDGVVDIAVLEGRIGNVRVTGNQHYSTDFITGHFAKAQEEIAARNATLERGLLLLNEYPDLKTSATLEPGKSPGTTDVLVTAEDKRPMHFMLDFNNYGFNTISRYRFGLGAEIGNVLTDGATLTLNAILGNQPDQLLFGMGTYSIPLGTQGTKLVVGASKGKFDVGAELASLQIRGLITTYDVAVTHPFIKSRFENLLGEFGFTGKDNRLLILGNLFGTDAVRALKLGVNWDLLDLSGRWYASAYGFQGLGHVLGGMDNDAPQATRQGADNRFTKGTLSGGRIQSLGHDVLLVLRGSGQITTGPVVFIEQMILGGPDSVRGYQMGERFVDEGYAVTAETRIPFFPSLMPSALKQTQGTIFVDHGGGRVRNPQPGEQRSASLTGTGVGMQTQLPWYNTNFRFDVGFPIGPKPIGGTISGDRSPTFYIQANTRF